MKCSKCGNEGVRNTVLGKEFYYCRTCKDEILPQPVAPESRKVTATETLNNKWYNPNQINPGVPTVPKFKAGDLARYVAPYYGSGLADFTDRKVYTVQSVDHHGHICVLNDQGIQEYVAPYHFEEVVTTATGASLVYNIPPFTKGLTSNFAHYPAPTDEEHTAWLKEKEWD